MAELPQATVASVILMASDAMSWENLRSQLLCCPKCAAENKALRFQCARLGGMCYVWCSACGFNSPENEHWNELMVDKDTGQDARPEAIGKWNAYARGESANG